MKFKGVSNKKEPAKSEGQLSFLFDAAVKARHCEILSHRPAPNEIKVRG